MSTKPTPSSAPTSDPVPQTAPKPYSHVTHTTYAISGIDVRITRTTEGSDTPAPCGCHDHDEDAEQVTSDRFAALSRILMAMAQKFGVDMGGDQA